MDTSVIPNGYYCYKFLEPTENGLFKIHGLCPYWKDRKDIDNKKVHDQNYGYCLFLGKGDLEMNHEDTYILKHPENHPDFNKEMTADEIGICLSTLWDMTKMCSENMDDPDAVYEQYSLGV